MSLPSQTNVTHRHCKGLSQSDRSPFSHFFVDSETGLGYTIHEVRPSLEASADPSARRYIPILES